MFWVVRRVKDVCFNEAMAKGLNGSVHVHVHILYYAYMYTFVNGMNRHNDFLEDSKQRDECTFSWGLFVFIVLDISVFIKQLTIGIDMLIHFSALSALSIFHWSDGMKSLVAFIFFFIIIESRTW